MENITFERAVKKQGSSLVVMATKELKLLDVIEGEVVRITIEKM